MDDHDRCLTCGQPVRPFTPDDTEITLTEAFTQRAHYCQTCFNLLWKDNT